MVNVRVSIQQVILKESVTPGASLCRLIGSHKQGNKYCVP